MATVKFPSIAAVADSLRRINRTLNPADYADDEACDIRLQTYADGSWAMRVGLSDYDQDHHGWFGSSSLNGTRFDSRAMAKDLIDQCRDGYAETIASMTYYTIVIPWVPAKYRTEWHPLESDKDGPFHSITRGNFPTMEWAIDWAKDKLNGTPYTVKLIKGEV